LGQYLVSCNLFIKRYALHVLPIIILKNPLLKFRDTAYCMQNYNMFTIPSLLYHPSPPQLSTPHTEKENQGLGAKLL